MKHLRQLMVVIITWLLVAPWSFAAVTPAKIGTVARLSEGHGTIFKRGFVDWTKETWGDPAPANIGDELYEGMQVGTGDKSWAQISWPNVTTRAWANTVVAVAPNQRIVYLLGGEMLFNLKKDRKDKGDYVIWTKVLQARIRGTTVLLQASHLVSRLCVLEGVVDVMNRLDHSVVRVSPGVVYEIRHNQVGGNQSLSPTTNNRPLAKEEGSGVENHPLAQTDNGNGRNDSQQGRQTLGETGPLLSSVHQDNQDRLVKGSGETSTFTPISVEGRPTLSLFETNNSTSSFFVANAESLGHHPLVVGFDSALESLPLVTTSLNKLPAICHLNSGDNPFTGNSNVPSLVANVGLAKANNVSDLKVIDKVLTDNVEVIRVPTLMSYKVGPLVGSHVVLPEGALSFWTPSGVIGHHEGIHNHNPLSHQANDKQPVMGGISSLSIKRDGLSPKMQYMESPAGLTSPDGPVNLSMFQQFNNIPPTMIRGFNHDHMTALEAGHARMHHMHNKFGFGNFELFNNLGSNNLMFSEPLKDSTGGNLPPPPKPIGNLP